MFCGDYDIDRLDSLLFFEILREKKCGDQDYIYREK